MQLPRHGLNFGHPFPARKGEREAGRASPQPSCTIVAADPLRPAGPQRACAHCLAPTGGAGVPAAQAQLAARGRLAEDARAVPRAPAHWPLEGGRPPARAAERADVGRVRRPVAGGGRKMAAGRGGGS